MSSFTERTGPASHQTSSNGLRIERLPDAPGTGSTTVKVEGEIDSANATVLQDCLELASDAERHLTVDMEGVTFIDSSGVNALVRVVKQTGTRHRGLVLQNPSPSVRMILGVLGLDESFGLDVVQFDEPSESIDA